MINKDDEMIGYIRNGEPCDFLKDDNTDIAEISAQQIRELLLETQVNNVRIRGAVISGTLDLRDTLSVEGAPVGGLELIDCVILEPLHLERSHLTYLSLLKSAFTELHAQNCRIEGHVDLGYVYSSEEHESRACRENPEFIDRVFTNIQIPKTGLSGPYDWWKYEVALKTTHDPKQDYQKRGRCQVDLSEASIGGSLYLDGCRLVAPAIVEKDKAESSSISAMNLSNAKVDGDCFVRGGHVRRDGSVISAVSGSFLGTFSGGNVTLLGDFWGCGGIYWGDSNRTVFFQGARIKGGVSFQKIKTDQSNKDELSKAVIRGQLNFSATRIEGWSDLRGLYCLKLIFSAATVGSHFQLQVEDKNEIELLQIVDINLRSLKVGGNLWISINNHNEAKEKNDSWLSINSSEVNGNFTLQGDIGSTVFAEDMRVNGSCLIEAHFRNHLTFSNLKVEGDFKFDSTIHKAVSIQDKSSAGKSETDSLQIIDLGSMKVGGHFLIDIKNYHKNSTVHRSQLIMSSSEVNGNFTLRGDIDSTVSAENMRVNGSCLIVADFRNYLTFSSLKVEGDFKFDSTIHKAVSIQDKSSASDWRALQDKSNIDAQAQMVLDGAEVKGNFTFMGDIDGAVSATDMRINGFCSIEDSAIFKEKVEFIALNTEGDVRFYPTIHKQADLSGIHVRGSLYLSSDLEKESGDFKSLKLVHQITSEDWRNFADSLSDRDIFLNKCFNEPSCGLILKHAVIGKELRIHRLQTDLGDMDTDFINWRDRFREVCRKLLRFLISVYKKEPSITFSKHLVKWAEIGLDRLYGISSKVWYFFQANQNSLFFK